MATLLYPRDSADKHLRAVRMHMRRCAIIKGSNDFATAIKPYYTQLSEKRNTSAIKAEEMEDAYDMAMFYDAELDANIKFLYSACDRYDQETPGALTLKKVFPQGKFTPITNMNYEKQIGEVKHLLLRLQSLGENHPLNTFVSEINDKLNSADNAISTYKAAVAAKKLAQSDEDIAKSALAAQYEHNYLEARKVLGRSIAEKLFPVIRKKNTPKEVVA